MARPKLANPKSYKLCTRLDSVTKQQLEHICNQSNTSISDTVRNSIAIMYLQHTLVNNKKQQKGLHEVGLKKERRNPILTQNNIQKIRISNEITFLNKWIAAYEDCIANGNGYDNYEDMLVLYAYRQRLLNLQPLLYKAPNPPMKGEITL